MRNLIRCMRCPEVFAGKPKQRYGLCAACGLAAKEVNDEKRRRYKRETKRADMRPGPGCRRA